MLRFLCILGSRATMCLLCVVQSLRVAPVQLTDVDRQPENYGRGGSRRV